MDTLPKPLESAVGAGGIATGDAAPEQAHSSFAGSVSAEHGIGLQKLEFIGISRSPKELALMRTLKTALDPKGILNPGKVVG